MILKVNIYSINNTIYRLHFTHNIYIQNNYITIGYHFVVYRDGSIHVGRAIEEVGAHCKGHNSISIGVCYIGGLSKKGKPKDTRTRDQKAAMQSLIEQLKEEFPLATIHGHNEFANKACPCFNVKKEWGKE